MLRAHAAHRRWQSGSGRLPAIAGVQDMILDWSELLLCYGADVARYRDRFATAGETTNALLCCRFTPSNSGVAASGGAHAERKLLISSLWTSEIPDAFANWEPDGSSPIVVTLVINRTPCRSCTGMLVKALSALQWQFAARVPQGRFLLACRGAYEGRPTEAGYCENATTMGDLKALQDVGWSPCVLKVGSELPPSGKQLLQALGNLRDNDKKCLHLPGASNRLWSSRRR